MTRRPDPLTLALCSGYFLVLLDVTIVNVALPSIGRGFGATSAGLAWVVDAYAVPLAALSLSAGAIGDRLGHRRVVLLGFAGFGIASVGCGAASTLPMLVASRAAQGITAALTLSGTLALLTQGAANPAVRARLVGLWAAVGGAALPVGPTLGGVLTQVAGWRAVFWINLPAVAAAGFIVARRASPPLRLGVERAVDWLGAAVLVLLIGSLVTAIIESRRDGAVAASAAVTALVAAGLLVPIERRATSPLLHIAPAARAGLAAAGAVAGLMNLCAVGTLFLLTQLLQLGHDLNPLTTGLLLLPAMIPLPLLGSPSGRLTNRIGPWPTAAVGLGLAAAGFAGIALATAHPASPAFVLALAVWGCGIGLLTPAVVVAAMRSTPETPGMASGASNAARQTGGAIGVALVSAIAGTATHVGFDVRGRLMLWGFAAVFVLVAVAAWTLSSRRADGPR